jgi:hypothetical protein
MPLLVVVVTAHAGVIDTVTKRRAELIPADMRAQNFAKLGGEEVEVSSYRVEAQSTVGHLLAHIEALGRSTTSGVIILTDDQLPELVKSLGDIFSVNRFTPPADGKRIGNLISATLVKALRAYRYFNKRFNDLKYQQILRLPLRNFSAQEVANMRTACRDMLNRENYGLELDQLLARFRQRQRPKMASAYPTVYFVDDDGKHFSLGPERHARADTAKPPHNDFCVLGNAFRFGRRFDGTNHFNVSRDRDAPMAGNYPDCHNAQRSGRDARHLNMFSNDFF